MLDAGEQLAPPVGWGGHSSRWFYGLKQHGYPQTIPLFKRWAKIGCLYYFLSLCLNKIVLLLVRYHLTLRRHIEKGCANRTVNQVNLGLQGI